jgi:hypothetical protein
VNIDKVLDFAAGINNADIEKICGLMTNDHSLDNRETGNENMKNSWITV